MQDFIQVLSTIPVMSFAAKPSPEFLHVVLLLSLRQPGTISWSLTFGTLTFVKIIV